LQAGRRRICVATYRWRGGEWRVREGPRLATWPTLVEETDSPTVFCGEIDVEGADALATLGELAVILPAAARLRRAGFLAEVAWRRLNRGETDDPATLVPIYLQYPT
jgi:tRNA threonylcarbamoyladenosine biosynthesis protein TsaB